MKLKYILRGIIAFSVIVILLVAGTKFYHRIFPIQHDVTPVFADKATKLLDTSNYDFLKDIGMNSNVIAIGESTHGSREFNKIRFDAFKFLVKKCGYTTFLIEGDFGDFLPISQYVETGNGNLRELLQDAQWWIWNTSEMYEIITWMRLYNVNPSHTVKLRFFGVDPRHKTKVLHFIISYYQAHNKLTSKQIIKKAQLLIRAKTGTKEHGRLVNVFLASIEKDLHAGSTIDESIRMIRFCQKVLERQYRLYSATTEGDQLKLRDTLMAANILDIIGDGQRAIFAAHMMHIRKDQRVSLLGLLTQNYCGYYLQRRLKDHFYALFIDFAFGNTRARSENQNRPHLIPLKEGELSYSFNQSHRASFFVNFRNAKQGITTVFDKTLDYQSLGSTYYDQDKTTESLNVFKGFDGYIYVPQVSASFEPKRSPHL